MKSCDNRKSADKLRDKTVFGKILMNNFADKIFCRKLRLVFNICAEAESRTAYSFLNDFFYAVKCTAANKEDV